MKDQVQFTPPAGERERAGFDESQQDTEVPKVRILFDWIKRGLSADDGSMDDARINAGMLVISYISMGIFAIYKVQSADMAAFVQAWAIGGAALAGGIGAWFGIRGKN